MELFPIGVVTRRTGLKPDVVRAWERRYGAVAPRRSEGDQRLYSAADIERLDLLRQATQAGHPIGRIARLDPAALRDLVRSMPLPAPGPGPAQAGDGVGAVALSRALAAVQALDAAALQRALDHGAAGLPRHDLVRQVLAPLLHGIGDRWEEGVFRPVHEHLASAAVRGFVEDLLRRAPHLPGAPRMVAGTPAGQRHELGALVVAALAATEEWSVTWLGPDLPAEDLALAARESGARVLALGITLEEGILRTVADLRTLADRLRGRTRLVLGGRALPLLGDVAREIGALTPRFEDLPAVLRSLS